jgi:hypothetical protein
MARFRRESHHSDGITDQISLQRTSATKSAISGLMHRSKELSLFEARSCVDELGHPSKLPLGLEAQPGNAGCAVVRFGSTRSENDA